MHCCETHLDLSRTDSYTEDMCAIVGFDLLRWRGEYNHCCVSYFYGLSETHGAVSFDGTKFCAVSNWAIPGGQVQAYIIDVNHLCGSSK